MDALVKQNLKNPVKIELNTEKENINGNDQNIENFQQLDQLIVNEHDYPPLESQQSITCQPKEQNIEVAPLMNV